MSLGRGQAICQENGKQTATFPGALRGLPTLATQNVSQLLDAKAQMVFRITSCSSAIAMGPLITHLRLKVGTGCAIVPSSTFNRSQTGFSSRLLHGISQLSSVRLKLVLANDDEEAYTLVRDVLGFLVAAKHLRSFEVRADNRSVPEVLSALPALPHLEALTLIANSRNTQNGATATAMNRAVRLCQFPALKHLGLGGQFLGVMGSSPLGLLTLWSRTPQAFAQLETVRLMFVQPVPVDSIAHFSTQLRTMPKQKQLQQLLITANYGSPFLLGACTQAPGLQDLKFSGFHLTPEQTADLLGAVAPEGGGGCLEQLGCMQLDDFSILTAAMQRGRLLKLCSLELDTQRLDPEDPDNTAVQLFQCLARDPSVCPLLATVVLRGPEASPPLFSAMWEAVACSARTISKVHLEYECQLEWQIWQTFSTGGPYNQLLELIVAGEGVTPVTAAGIVAVLLANCKDPSVVEVCMTIDGEVDELASFTESCLKADSDRSGSHATRAGGLKRITLLGGHTMIR